MAEEFNPQDMIERFKLRAEVVRSRQIPPVEGEDRKRFIEQAQLDFMDFSIIADAKATLEDGILHIEVDLRADENREGSS